MTSQAAKLDLVLPVGVHHAELSEVCITAADRSGIGSNSLKLYGKPLSQERVRKSIASKQHFYIDGGGFEANFSSIPNYRISLLSIAGIDDASSEQCAEDVKSACSLISARWFDAEYELWQNAEDLRTFENAHRSIEGLPMRHNGLPSPLGEMIVDTSRNPGRLILRDGYVEAIGHRMWLGPMFFERVPAVSLDAVMSSQWIITSRCPAGFVRVMASKEVFRDTSTADIQRRLRNLLFPTTADSRSSRDGRSID